MNIYIRIEVLSRELQGRLFLALAAAERGHRVVIGKHNAARILGTDGFPGYPLGLFHDKSLGYDDPKTDMKKTLVARGWGVTAQDEEHGLVTEVFGEDILDRFPDEGFEYNHLLFAWGRFDCEALHALRPNRLSQILQTGSPRVDLWRQDLANVHDEKLVDAVTEGRPFVLVNPIGGWNPGAPESVFGLDGTSMDDERIERLSQQLLLMSRFVGAADALARSYPDMLVILRPHPGAPIDIWVKAADKCPANVVVSREARLTPWLHRAQAVVTNGSTVAFEALMVGTPYITFAPDGHLQYNAVTHRLGRTATSVEALSQAIEDARSMPAREQWYSREMQDIVQHRFAALDGRFAADRIIDEWEQLGDDLGLLAAEPWTGRVLAKQGRSGSRSIRSLARRLGTPSAQRAKAEVAEKTSSSERRPRWTAPRATYQEKFPPLDAEDVKRFHTGLIRATGRFSDVRIDFQHDRLMLVTREG